MSNAICNHLISFKDRLSLINVVWDTYWITFKSNYEWVVLVHCHSYTIKPYFTQKNNLFLPWLALFISLSCDQRMKFHYLLSKVAIKPLLSPQSVFCIYQDYFHIKRSFFNFDQSGIFPYMVRAYVAYWRIVGHGFAVLALSLNEKYQNSIDLKH